MDYYYPAALAKNSPPNFKWHVDRIAIHVTNIAVEIPMIVSIKYN